MPTTSRLSVALRGSEHDGWDLTAHLLAALIDAANTTTYAVAQVHSKKRLAKPEPVPRPGATTKPTRTVTVAQLAKRVRQHR
ncbi:hypothetical protein [Stackebrandtia nassauensis]|uniref:hypothetical protein n=1 Tax=Stackebrandtia nassauensis TaxID=283811 RepID=UPI001B7F9899|nr:hypothetical protein [Stackebrandtia nassauensis]